MTIVSRPTTVTPTRQKRAAIYCRVSTRAQEDNTSLKTQEIACRQYAAEHGYHLDDEHIYHETHTGAELWERPRLTVLRQVIRARSVDVIIFYAVDRLSRDQVHIAILVDECARAGVALRFVTEQFDHSPVGKFILSAKSFAAEVEREKIRERTTRGIRARLDAGKLRPSNRPLFGYHWRDAGTEPRQQKVAYVVDEPTAQIVRRIFVEYVEGQSLRKIAEGLTRDSIKTPTGKTDRWCATTVHYLLVHRAYIGDGRAMVYHHEKVPGRKSPKMTIRPEAEQVRLPEGTVPPLVDEATFAAAQARLVTNKERMGGRPSRDPEAAILRGGYARCGYCGRALSVRWQSQSQKRTPKAFYSCNTGARDRHGCPSFTMLSEGLDAAVWTRVETILTHPEVIAAELERMRQSDQTARNLAAVDRALTDVRRRQSNLTRALSLLDDPDSAAPLVAELETLAQRKKRLEAERDTVGDQHRNWQHAQERLEDLQAWCRTVAERLGALTYEQKRLALDALGIRVQLWKADHTPRFQITATIPLDREDHSGEAVSGQRILSRSLC